MKDAYSFDANVEGLNKSYDAMYGAYQKIFTRCGCVRDRRGDPAIGGSASTNSWSLRRG